MSARSRSAPWFRTPGERYEATIARIPLMVAFEPYRFFFCVQCGYPAWLEDDEALDDRPPNDHNVRITDVRRENGVTRVNGIVLLVPLLCNECLRKEAA